MKLITPIFYAEGKTGYWAYNGTEAKSIRELLEKLGEGFQVENYFPDGYPFNLTRRGTLFEPHEHVAQGIEHPPRKPQTIYATAVWRSWGCNKPLCIHSAD